MKKFAYYLPQFHCIPENDRWWGNGFTEWTNVKKAKPLFRNHLQPRIPLDDNYYQLLDVKTLSWQAYLANTYHVDGMIFYHYYFAGKKLLEKPAELLLENKEIPMHFFFCWANHSWYKAVGGKKEMLMEQTYGDKKIWEEHIAYLLDFFKDSRYEKKNNKPLFMLYNCEFPEKNEMLRLFDQKCREAGFDGINVIERISGFEAQKLPERRKEAETYTEYLYLREPDEIIQKYIRRPEAFVLHLKNKIKRRFPGVVFPRIMQYDGNALYDEMMKDDISDSKVIRGVFFEWDNTPRHGRRGFIITPPDKERFMQFMDKNNDADYLFINAWNEWCEGMMLEPTVDKGYRYLEWMKEWSERNQ